jgi:hypothetical protein
MPFSVFMSLRDIRTSDYRSWYNQSISSARADQARDILKKVEMPMITNKTPITMSLTIFEPVAKRFLLDRCQTFP